MSRATAMIGAALIVLAFVIGVKLGERFGPVREVPVRASFGWTEGDADYPKREYLIDLVESEQAYMFRVLNGRDMTAEELMAVYLERDRRWED